MLTKGVFWALHTRHLQNGTAPGCIAPFPKDTKHRCLYISLPRQEIVTIISFHLGRFAAGQVHTLIVPRLEYSPHLTGTRCARFLELLASTYGPGPYAPGPYGPMLQDHIWNAHCSRNMLLEQYAFQIFSWSIFDWEYSSRILMVQEHMVQDHMVLDHKLRQN